MAKFDAATAVEPLELDWSKYDGPVGVIPEPSTNQMTKFQNALLGAARELGIRPGQELSLEDVAELPEDLAEKLATRMKTAVVDLCGGLVSEEDYDKLPFRVQVAFTTWMAGELRPEAPTPGMKK